MRSWRMPIAVLAGMVLTAGALAADGAGRIAVTIDDLPYAGGSMQQARAATDALIAALARVDATADLFVIGERVEVDGEMQARRALLHRWLDAGHRLHNHGYRHLRYSEHTIPVYLDDVARGHALVSSLLAEAPGARGAGYFRAPFNDLGDGAEPRDRLDSALSAQGVRLAPFTVEHADWLFDAAYRRARAAGDDARRRRIAEAYLLQLDRALDFAEALTVETFGREIPQVLLIHANHINADLLPAMLARLQARGYRFVSMDEALRDPAYATADAYRAHWGVSWLHRWRVTLGLSPRLREAPEPPRWLMETHADN